MDNSTDDPIAWTPPQISNTRFTTSGHSLENYGFNLEFVRSYIAHFGSDVPVSAINSSLETSFSSLVRLSAAFSEVARKNGIISRCENLVAMSDVELVNSKFRLGSQFYKKLDSRNIVNSGSLVAEINHAADGKWGAPPLSLECHLHSHGHIGEMLIWIGVGKIAESLGVDTNTSEQIAYGRRDERRRVWHSWLTTIDSNQISPMDRVFIYEQPCHAHID